ncbi:hypothetical protein KVP09_02135 [Alcaligenaceae bacterium CGII-47]|nr:hypothetical protein [Alcaligenaceae bacterium CGII-47]
MGIANGVHQGVYATARSAEILGVNNTNLSARTGEAGRGFAVVAGEVRSLAQKSAQAAKEIKTLIDDSVSRMQVGAQQADRAEQSCGLVQINQAISQMDGVTHQNAALVQDLGSTVRGLTVDAQTLLLAIEALNTGSENIQYSGKANNARDKIPGLSMAYS